MNTFLLLILLVASVEISAVFHQKLKFIFITSKRTFYSAPISYYGNHCSRYRLQLSGDIEINPGPTLCISCDKTVRINSKRVECICCKEQQHLACCKNPAITVQSARIPAPWTCNQCLLSILPFHQVREINETETIPDNDQYVQPSLTLLNNHRKHLSVAHLNTQSMASTFGQFEAMLEAHQFDLITLSETWLKDNKNLLNHFEVCGYKKDFRNRDAKRGGGVGYYIKKDIQCKNRKDIESLDRTIEHQWIEFTGKTKLANILIGIVYQPSSVPREKIEWLDKLETILSQITLIHQGPIMITGDFNIDLLKESQERDIYLHLLETFNLVQHITKPTRKSKTLIDHLITSVGIKLIAEDIVPCDEISDHDAPFCILKIKKPRFEPRFKYIRDERAFVLDDFVSDFRNLPLNIVYAVDDVSDKVSMFNDLAGATSYNSV